VISTVNQGIVSGSAFAERSHSPDRDPPFSPEGTMTRELNIRRVVVAAILAIVAGAPLYGRPQAQNGVRFRTAVELVNVTATVTDDSGRFVPGLKQTDFLVYDDEQLVEVTHFSAERVPVSLGIVLDTSGSMVGEKIAAARAALNRFLFDLLGPEDEVFLYRFDSKPHLVQAWTNDRERVAAELRRLRADGATALYDAVAEALPLLQSGRHTKKALLVISDGNDTNSRTDLQSLKQLIRQSEALVYAIGIDTELTLKPLVGHGGIIRHQRGRPFPLPFPLPGRGMPPRNPPVPGVPPQTPQPPVAPVPEDPPDQGRGPLKEPVNLPALRDITDDSGGRTELVRDPRDLDPTTARIADELSKQYFLGYTSPDKHDGRWHTIRVEVRDRSLHVRARSGYMAAS
jgi:VWFA-related protein